MLVNVISRHEDEDSVSYLFRKYLAYRDKCTTLETEKIEATRRLRELEPKLVTLLRKSNKPITFTVDRKTFLFKLDSARQSVVIEPILDFGDFKTELILEKFDEANIATD